MPYTDDQLNSALDQLNAPQGAPAQSAGVSPDIINKALDNLNNPQQQPQTAQSTPQPSAPQQPQNNPFNAAVSAWTNCGELPNLAPPSISSLLPNTPSKQDLTNADKQTLDVLKSNGVQSNQTSVPVNNPNQLVGGQTEQAPISRSQQLGIGATNSLENAQTTFKTYYPNGDLKQDQDGSILFSTKVQKNPDGSVKAIAPYFRMSPTTQETMYQIGNTQDPIKKASIILDAIGSYARDNPGETLAGAFLTVLGPGKLIPTLLKAGAINYGADAIQGAYQASQKMPMNMHGWSDLFKTLETVGVGLGVKAIPGIGAWLTGEGKGFMSLNDAQRQTIEAFNRLQQGASEKLHILPTQLAHSPMAKTIEAYLNRVSSAIKDYSSKQMEAVSKPFAASVDQNALANAPKAAIAAEGNAMTNLKSHNTFDNTTSGTDVPPTAASNPDYALMDAIDAKADRAADALAKAGGTAEAYRRGNNWSAYRGVYENMPTEEILADMRRRPANAERLDPYLVAANDILTERRAATEGEAATPAPDVPPTSGPLNLGISSKVAGDTVNSDLSTLAKRSQEPVKSLYAARDQILPGHYTSESMAPAFKAADEVAAGVKQSVTEMQPTKILGPDSQPVMAPVNVDKQLKPPPQALQDAINDINRWKNSDPRPTMNNGKIDSVPDQIMAIQQNIYEQKLAYQESNGHVGIDEASANKLIDGLQKSLANPVGTGTEWLTAHKAATTAASNRLTMLKNPLISRANRQELDEILSTGESSINAFENFNGKYVTALDRLKEIAQPETYNTVISRINTKLMDYPDKLTATLNKLENTSDGREFAKRVFVDQNGNYDPSVLQNFKDYGSAIDKLNDLGLKSKTLTLSKDQQYGLQMGQKYIKDLLGGEKVSANADTLENLTNNNPDLKEAVHSGIMQELLTSSTSKYSGELGNQVPAAINSQALEDKFRKLETDGIAKKFLSPQDMQLLHDVANVSNTVALQESTGAGFASSEQGAHLIESMVNVLHNPGQATVAVLAHAVGTLLENKYAARILASKGLYRFLYGNSMKDINPSQPGAVAKVATRIINYAIGSQQQGNK